VSKGGLNRTRLLAAFDALSSELATQEVRGELFVVGGAAMALAYSARRVTRDVDAIFEPKAVIYQAARVIAAQLDLPDDWLNDAVKSFAPWEDLGSRVVFSTPSLEVSAASPRYLLAMKLLAARVDQDVDDIRVLYEQCGFTTAAEGMDLLEAVYPAHPLEPRTQFLLEEMFPE
jgi:Nucleotidyltransferase of unknown function (DUF6036)